MKESTREMINESRKMRGAHKQLRGMLWLELRSRHMQKCGKEPLPWDWQQQNYKPWMR